LVDTIPVRCTSTRGQPISNFVPTFYVATVDLASDPEGDTFLSLPTLQKGIAWINGHPLGRYWRVGPQRTLFVPRPYLVRGENTLVVLELDGTGGFDIPEALFGDRMEYGNDRLGGGGCGSAREEGLWGSPMWPWVPVWVVVVGYFGGVAGRWKRRWGYRSIR